uniref:Uncharacterized protein n=1 Tax=Aureoumbra lagunensis TaxID=44058 RepID=A0A7S3K0I3_9STRA
MEKWLSSMEARSFGVSSETLNHKKYYRNKQQHHPLDQKQEEISSSSRSRVVSADENKILADLETAFDQNKININELTVSQLKKFILHLKKKGKIEDSRLSYKDETKPSGRRDFKETELQAKIRTALQTHIQTKLTSSSSS